MTPFERSELIKSLAREVGFDLAGVTRAAGSEYAEAYRQWIAAGKHGAMEYMARGVEERVDVTRKFPWAKSVVCVGMAYWQEEKPEATSQEPEEGKHETRIKKHESRSTNHETEEGKNETPITKNEAERVTIENRKLKIENGMGKIARYAWGRDYHKVVEGKLSRMERRMREVFLEGAGIGEGLQVRAYCDTGPVMERELAQRAGLGWAGKNTLLIHPRHGSWFVLGELILNVELAPDEAVADHCGTCRRCIEACPTQAIAPYSVDATRCISYLTLENRGEIGAEFFPAMREAGYVAGCDICQEVCPFNRDPLETREADFLVRGPAPAVGLAEILRWQEHEWDQLTRGRAFRRAKFAMWKRNAGILGGGTGNDHHRVTESTQTHRDDDGNTKTRRA
jgi:epoxyqueuosine reductase